MMRLRLRLKQAGSVGEGLLLRGLGVEGLGARFGVEGFRV